MARKGKKARKAKEEKRSAVITIDLAEQVLVLLPAEQVIAMRAVCREWRDLIASPTFRELWRSREARRRKISSSSSSFVVRYRYANRHTSRCYSSGLERLCNVPNAELMPKDAFVIKDCNRSLVAARSAGLIFVGNPITGAWISFKPPMLMHEWESKDWTLIAALDAGSAKKKKHEDCVGVRFQMLIDDFLFDSNTRLWKMIELPTTGEYGRIYSDGCSTIYYLCHNGAEVKMMKGRIGRKGDCSVETEATSRMIYPKQHRLIQYGDEIGMICCSKTEICVKILIPASQEWVTRSSMPRSLFDRIGYEKTFRRITGGTSRFTFVAAESGLVAFDSQDDSWYWIDDPMYVEPFERKWQFFCLEPSF